MTPADFRSLMLPIARSIAGRPVDATLAGHLDREHPADGPEIQAIEAACHAGIEAGWMCTQGGPGRRFGRIIEPSADTGDLSVDVVDLTDVVGPHHRHPNGEICLVMPVSPSAAFDGKPGRGWCVYGPGSGHRPTVSNGRALVLYLLPDGKIEFTGQ
jgi:Domain of unknown function (DUF4863)